MKKYSGSNALVALLTLLKGKFSTKVDKVDGQGLSANNLTADLKKQYDAAYTHSQTTHAPSNAERNTLVGIQKNGTDVSINTSTRKANITVPTKVSELDNDSEYLYNTEMYQLTRLFGYGELTLTSGTFKLHASPQLIEISSVSTGNVVARLRSTDDNRGNLQMYNASGTLMLNAYANTSGAEIDLHNGSGARRAALYTTASGSSCLLLTDSSGNNYTLTPEKIKELNNLIS